MMRALRCLGRGSIHIVLLIVSAVMACFPVALWMADQFAQQYPANPPGVWKILTGWMFLAKFGVVFASPCLILYLLIVLALKHRGIHKIYISFILALSCAALNSFLFQWLLFNNDIGGITIIKMFLIAGAALGPVHWLLLTLEERVRARLSAGDNPPER